MTNSYSTEIICTAAKSTTDWKSSLRCMVCSQFASFLFKWRICKMFHSMRSFWQHTMTLLVKYLCATYFGYCPWGMSGTLLPSRSLGGDLFMMADFGIVSADNLHVPHFWWIPAKLCFNSLPRELSLKLNSRFSVTAECSSRKCISKKYLGQL